MSHAILIIVALGGLMHAARSFLPSNAALPAGSGTALAFGFLLLGAFYSGKLFAALQLPRLTGYLVAGVVAGPSVLSLVSREMVRSLGPVQGLAICLIALSAGGELNFKRMRPLFPTIRSMTLWIVGGSSVVCTGVLLSLRDFLPFMDGLSPREAGAACAVLGVSLSAMSPAVVMALLNELSAEGPLSRTILGVVVAADLAVIVLFAFVGSAARSVLGGSADIGQAIVHLSWELFGSALAGVAIGILLAVYLRNVREGQALFVLLVCLVVSEIGGRLALDPLIIALTAGLVMENVLEIETTKLIHEIEAASLPVYVVFFAVAGTALRLDVFSAVAVPAIVLVAARGGAFWFFTGVAARSAHAEPKVSRWAFTGFLPQAGLALALPLLYPEILPGIAEGAAALVLGIVGINQLLMPVLLRFALVRSGEAGQAVATEPAETAEPA